MANTFAETAIKFVVDGGALKTQLGGIERAVGEAAGRMASTVKTAMLGLGTAVAGGVGTMAVLVTFSADAGDELAKMSQRVAISGETLGGYGLAAGLAGTWVEDFGTA